MNPLSSILVDMDALAASHPALEQAVGYAARCGACVKVVDVLAWVPSNARHFVRVRFFGQTARLRIASHGDGAVAEQKGR